MKIDSSTINMDSRRSYTQSTEQAQAVTAKGTSGSTIYRSSVSFLQSYTQYNSVSASKTRSGQYDSYEPTSKDGSEASAPLTSGLYTNMSGANISLVDARNALEDFRKQFIEHLEQFMERIRQQLLGGGSYQLQKLYETSTVSSYTQLQQTSGGYITDLTTTVGQPGTMWTLQKTATAKQTEAETTSFNGRGSVQTADGRSIDFNVSMQMSRAFIEESSILSNSTQYVLTDPLVIQLEDAPNTISDQKWFFDIDGDGVKEEISQLANGNGFLALDENENGIIDDGSELFGTKSGNGFSDLAAYDEDGNGWIDENDSVYSKLKIWTKDANGNDKLMDLKQADIGAIYLGYADTEFTHKSLNTNETQAVVRQTGIYLRESTGTAGTIQQVDFASSKSA